MALRDHSRGAQRIEAGEPITGYETWDRIYKLYG